MNSPEFKDTVCRICLDGNVVLDWNQTLVDDSDITYKDCYYKYTQLECLDGDLFSTMLCQNCLNSLENVHAFILKAIDSYNFLLEVNCTNSELENSAIINDDTNDVSNDFETVLVEKTDTESSVQDQYEYESFEDFFESSKYQEDDLELYTNKTLEIEIGEALDVQRIYEKNNCLQLNNNAPKSIDTIRKRAKRNTLSNSFSKNEVVASDDERIYKNLKRTRNNTDEKKEIQTEEELIEEKVDTPKTRKLRSKYKSENTPSMCSFCSKILHNKYSLQKHERIHNANRERKATCPICGVKYFEEAYLKAHMHIHNDKRVKKHKCEFCDKAFYGKGGLNIHRRIHLGQMIPCNLCPKQFFRKVDLNIHMNSHSASLITAETKKRSRYWVRCKYCNKSVVSTSFKSHNAAHLNEPLMKCSICNKEFFRRDSCTQHLKSIHQKTTDEYNDFIVLYSKNRLSHLYLEQKAEIEVNEN